MARRRRLPGAEESGSRMLARLHVTPGQMPSPYAMALASVHNQPHLLAR